MREPGCVLQFECGQGGGQVPAAARAKADPPPPKAPPLSARDIARARLAERAKAALRALPAQEGKARASRPAVVAKSVAPVQPELAKPKEVPEVKKHSVQPRHRVCPKLEEGVRPLTFSSGNTHGREICGSLQDPPFWMGAPLPLIAFSAGY